MISDGEERRAAYALYPVASADRAVRVAAPARLLAAPEHEQHRARVGRARTAPPSRPGGDAEQGERRPSTIRSSSTTCASTTTSTSGCARPRSTRASPSTRCSSRRWSASAPPTRTTCPRSSPRRPRSWVTYGRWLGGRPPWDRRLSLRCQPARRATFGLAPATFIAPAPSRFRIVKKAAREEEAVRLAVLPPPGWGR